jgi:hypothetical protein
MSAPDDSPPLHLRRAIASDLAPVRPLASPLRRALALLPLAIVLVLAQPMLLGIRHDAAQLGPTLLWGLSLGQSVLGALLLVAALREAVPGRGLSFSPVLLVSGAVACLAVTYATWSHSMTRVPPGHFTFFWEVCFAGPIVLGLPVVCVALWMAVRAYPLRPALVGALAGLGVGLLTDAGWRTFCHVSEPRHVLSAHVAAVLVLCGLGTLLGPVLSRRRM